MGSKLKSVLDYADDESSSRLSPRRYVRAECLCEKSYKLAQYHAVWIPFIRKIIQIRRILCFAALVCMN